MKATPAIGLGCARGFVQCRGNLKRCVSFLVRVTPRHLLFYTDVAERTTARLDGADWLLGAWHSLPDYRRFCLACSTGRGHAPERHEWSSAEPARTCGWWRAGVDLGPGTGVLCRLALAAGVFRRRSVRLQYLRASASDRFCRQRYVLSRTGSVDRADNVHGAR